MCNLGDRKGMYQHIILNCLLRLDATVVLVGGRPCTGLFKLLVDKFFKLHAALVNTRVVSLSTMYAIDRWPLQEQGPQLGCGE